MRSRRQFLRTLFQSVATAAALSYAPAILAGPKPLPWTSDTIKKHWLKGNIPDGVWRWNYETKVRVLALKKQFRQTYRINPRIDAEAYIRGLNSLPHSTRVHLVTGDSHE